MAMGIRNVRCVGKGSDFLGLAFKKGFDVSQATEDFPGSSRSVDSIRSQMRTNVSIAGRLSTHL